MTNQLTRDEYVTAAHAGMMRFRLGEFRQHRHGYDLRTPWDEDMANQMRAAVSELVVCKWASVYWRGLGDVGYRDTPIGEVRTTPHLHGGLLLRPGDNPEERYFLVLGRPPSLHVAGWAWGREVMVDVYAREPQPGRPCWIMPPADLHRGRP